WSRPAAIAWHCRSSSALRCCACRQERRTTPLTCACASAGCRKA
ncbi:MAG: hypothetical protein AVDCRST_MAG08-4575, partial [uncultured Acetobacteraceae bacterium]